jgi:hypothetical protein
MSDIDIPLAANNSIKVAATTSVPRRVLTWPI